MKAIKIITAAALIIMMTAFSSFAKDNKTNQKSSLKKVLAKEISYPEFAIETEKEGAVFVQFTISDEGKIIIENMNYEDVTLGDYVKEQLSKVVIDNTDTAIGSTHAMKFDFKLMQ